MRTISLLLCMLGGICTMSQAQGPLHGGPAIGIVPPPGKLHVRLQGDPGTRISYLAGPHSWKTQDVPCDLTLQPGARYLLKVEGLKNSEGLTYYPTLEVVDVLYLPEKLNAADHPAPIQFTETDGLAVNRGAMITKVVTLEDPESPFVGINGNVNGADAEPLGGLDALTFAKEVGRPVAILRWGNKEPTPLELEGKAFKLPTGVPGCANGPMVPIKPFKIGEECLRDGGDFHKPAHFADGKLRGLDPSDTVMTYKNHKGQKLVLPSNPVCVCVPRFVSLRQVTLIEAFNLNEAANRLARADMGILLEKQDRAIPAKQLEESVLLRLALKPMADISTDKLMVHTKYEGVRTIMGRLEKALEQVGVDVPPTDCVDEPLELCKSVSPLKAQIGDVVTFTIKYSNKTCQPIHDVAISDSLASRFEYIPGTAKSTREAIFVTTNNEAGSLVLRWELKDPIPAKQTGEVTFQARVK